MNILSWLRARGYSREDLARSDNILEGRTAQEPVSTLLSAATASTGVPASGERAAVAAFRAYHRPTPRPAVGAAPAVAVARSPLATQLPRSPRARVAKVLAGGLAFSLIGGVTYAATAGGFLASKPEASVAARQPASGNAAAGEITEDTQRTLQPTDSTAAASDEDAASPGNAKNQDKKQAQQHIRDNAQLLRACLDLDKRKETLLPKDSALIDYVNSRDLRSAESYCTRLVTEVCTAKLIPQPGSRSVTVPGLHGTQPKQSGASREMSLPDNKIVNLCRNFTDYSLSPDGLLRPPTTSEDKGKPEDKDKAEREDDD